jgi:hypothetical protein
MKLTTLVFLTFLSTTAFSAEVQELAICVGEHGEKVQVMGTIYDEQSWCNGGEATVYLNNELFDNVSFNSCSKRGFHLSAAQTQDKIVKTIFIGEIGNTNKLVTKSQLLEFESELRCTFSKSVSQYMQGF